MVESRTIRSAARDEMPQTISIIVAAFLTDPLARFIWPSPHEHLGGMARTTRAFAGAAFEHGTADVSSDFRGAGLWLPPGAHPDGDALEAVFRETAAPAHLDDVLGTFEEMDRWHPSEPHWYLPLVGVEPHAQRSGLGGALMRHAVQRCDEAGALAYLESSNPRNIALYQRHGFEVMGEIQVGAGPLVTPMQRRPR